MLQLFGSYAGTDRINGLRWANPLLSKRSVRLRVCNIESGRLKVNDAVLIQVSAHRRFRDEKKLSPAHQ